MFNEKTSGFLLVLCQEKVQLKCGKLSNNHFRNTPSRSPDRGHHRFGKTHRNIKQKKALIVKEKSAQVIALTKQK